MARAGPGKQIGRPGSGGKDTRSRQAGAERTRVSGAKTQQWSGEGVSGCDGELVSAELRMSPGARPYSTHIQVRCDGDLADTGSVMAENRRDKSSHRTAGRQPTAQSQRRCLPCHHKYAGVARASLRCQALAVVSTAPPTCRDGNQGARTRSAPKAPLIASSPVILHIPKTP